MIIRYLLFLLLTFLSLSTISQTNFWLQQAGGSGNDEALAVANFQNFTYTTGYYSDYTTFGSFNLSPLGAGDIFVSKQAPTGEHLWVKQFGGYFPERGLCITTLSNGNVCVGGITAGTVNFGNIQLTTNDNSQDIFIVCLDPQGNVLWAKLFGSKTSDVISDIKADNNDNIIFTGQFSDTLQIGNDTFASGINPNNNVPSYDILIAKLNVSGNPIWINHGKTTRSDRSLNLAIAPDNSIYVTGIFSSAIEFRNTLDNTSVNYSNNSNAMGFLMKLNSNGNPNWFRRAWSNVTSIAGVACTNNNVYIAGDFVGKQKITTSNASSPSQTFEEVSTKKYYLTSFQSNGTLDWCKTEGSSSPVRVKDITIFAQDKVAIVGEFECLHSTYNTTYGTGLFISRGYSDVFVSAFNTQGTRIWAKQIGGLGREEVNAATFNSTGNPVFVGSFDEKLASPAKNTWGFKPWYEFPFSEPQTVCNDNFYRTYATVATRGNKDIYIANIADTTRRTLDAFKRSDGACDFGTVAGNIGVIDFSICTNDTLVAELPTESIDLSGFSYTYLWNNSSSNEIYVPIASGNVSLIATAKNTCFSFTDDLLYEYVIQTPTPVIYNNYGNPLPLGPGGGGCPNKLVVVLGDTVTLTGNTVSGLFERFWTLPNGTELAANSYTTNIPGTYYYNIRRTDGNCLRRICLEIVVFSASAGGICEGVGRPIIPEFVTEGQFLDTLRGCPDKVYQIEFVDSLLFIANIPTIINLYARWSVVSSQTLNTPSNVISPEDDFNYYTLGLHIKNYKINQSGNAFLKIEFLQLPDNVNTLFTYYHPFYVDAYPLPVITYSLTGNYNNVCPRDTPLVFFESNAQSITFPNSAINLDTSTTTASFQLVIPKLYNISLYSINTYGCKKSVNASFLMKYKDTPLIVLNPSDGYVCQDSEIALSTIPADTISWRGPTNASLPSDFIYNVNVPGYYYAFLTDLTGCPLVSNTVEIREFTTPNVNLSSERLCKGDSITFELELLEGDSVLWLYPLSGNSFQQTVRDTGEYTYKIFACGQEKLGSVNIKYSEIQARIEVLGDTIQCPSQTISLKGNTEDLTSLLWLETNDIDTLIQVTSDAVGIKTYTLEVTDEFGCITLDTARIHFEELPKPLKDTILICQTDSFLIELTDTNIVNWYINNTLSNSNTLSFNFLENYIDSTISINYIDPIRGCNSAIVTLNFKYKPKYEINPIEDTLVCLGLPFQLPFSLTENNASDYRWVFPDSSILINSLLNLSSVTFQNQGLYSLIAFPDDNYCGADTTSFRIDFLGVDLPYQLSSPSICSESDWTIELPADSSYIINWTYLGINNNGYSLTIPGNSIDTGIVTINNEIIYNAGCIVNDTFQVLSRISPPAPAPIDSVKECYADQILIFLDEQEPFYWFIGDELTSNIPSLFFNYLNTNADSGLYIASFDSTIGCYSAKREVPIFLKPTFTLPTPTPTVKCIGGYVQFSANPAQTGAVSYRWLFNNLVISTDSILSLNNLQQNQQGVYTLQAFGNDNYCGADTVQFTLTIVTLPQAEITSIPSNNICRGSNFEISINATETLNATWFLNDGSSVQSNSLQFNPFILPGNSFDVSLLISNVAGCQSTIPFSIPVFDTPPAPNTVATIDMCGNLPAPINLSSNYSVVWYSGNTLIQSIPSSSFILEQANATIYIANFDSATNCFSPRIPVPFNIKPYFQLEPIEDIIVCKDAPLQFSFNPTQANATFFNWVNPNGQSFQGSVFSIQETQDSDAGIYSLIAQGNNNFCGSDTVNFNVIVVPLPQATISSIPANNICRGSSFEVSFTSPENVTATWFFNDSNSATTNTLLYEPYNLPENIFGTILQITNPLGCVSNTVFTIPVFDPPSPPNPVETINLCGDLPLPISLPQDYSVVWYIGNELDQSTPSSNYTLNQANANIYIANFNSSTNCFSQKVPVPIIIKPYFQLEAIEDFNICRNEEFLVSFNPVQANAISFNWLTPNAQVILENQINVPQIQTTDGGIYALIATGNDNFCGADTVQFNVNVLPLPVPNIIVSEEQICTAYKWQAYVNQDNTTSSNVWNYSSNSITGDTVDFNSNTLTQGTFEILLEQTAINGCSAKDSVNITVNQSPIPPPEIDSLSVCSGNLLNINLAPTSQVYWFIGDSLIQSNASSLLDYNFSLQNLGLSIANFDATENCYSSFIPIPIELKPEFVLPTFSDTTVCAGDTISFRFSPNAVNTASYHWMIPLYTIITDSVIQINTANFLNNGEYSLMAVSDTNRCGSDTSSFNFMVNDIPEANITTSDAFICTNRLWTVSINPDPNYSALWTYNNYQYDSYAAILNIPSDEPDSAIIYLDLTSAEGCKTRDSIVVDVHSSPFSPILTLQDSVCIGDTIVLNIDLQVTPTSQFYFESNTHFNYQNNQLIYYPDSINQGINLIAFNNSGFCISDTASFSFNVGELPIFNFEDTLTFCKGEELTIQSFGNYQNYLWNTGATSNFLNVLDSGYYKLTVTDFNGCIWTDSIYAFVDVCDVEPKPNVFTPNGDGYNDKFILEAHGMKFSTIVIFDRWGKKLAEYSNIQEGWDGKNIEGNEMPSGVYFYVANAAYINGKSQEIKGSIQLIK